MLKQAKTILLPGFLGSARDFDELLVHLDFSCQPLELPKKGNWQKRTELIAEQLDDSVLIGYSMGGRLALLAGMLYPKKVRGVIAISAHPGLTREEKEERVLWEKRWLKLLESEPLDYFLRLWYDQPLFNTLKQNPNFSNVMARRLALSREDLIATFFDLRLSAQPNLWPLLPQFKPRLNFIFGKEDAKFCSIHNRLKKNMMASFLLPTGHAPHLEEPEALASLINQLMRSDYDI